MPEKERPVEQYLHHHQRVIWRVAFLGVIRIDLLEVQQFYHLIDDTSWMVRLQKIVRLDLSINRLTLIVVLENRHRFPLGQLTRGAGPGQ
jgi:hypothetical protein